MYYLADGKAICTESGGKYKKTCVSTAETQAVNIRQITSALDGTGSQTAHEIAAEADENDQNRDDGDGRARKHNIPGGRAVSGVLQHVDADRQGTEAVIGHGENAGHNVLVPSLAEGEDGDGGHHGLQHGDDDLVIGLEEGAAVDSGSLIQFLRNRTKILAK